MTIQELLIQLDKGLPISNTSIRTLAKGGYVQIYGETKVYIGGETRKIYKTRITSLGRQLMEIK